MNTHTPKTLNIDQNNHRWIVQFAFRFNDDNQRNVVDNLGVMVYYAIRLWIDVITPGACVLEPAGTLIEHVAFPSRSSARRFKQTWGGRILGF
jgi:hypothetical protein